MFRHTLCMLFAAAVALPAQALTTDHWHSVDLGISQPANADRSTQEARTFVGGTDRRAIASARSPGGTDTIYVQAMRKSVAKDAGIRLIIAARKIPSTGHGVARNRASAASIVEGIVSSQPATRLPQLSALFAVTLAVVLLFARRHVGPVPWQDAR